MFSLDDRPGNVVTTVALFMAAAAILYMARGAFLVLLLSLLFAYLLEPAVTLVQHSRVGQKNRTWAIAQVYLIGTIGIGSLVYTFGPQLVAQIKNLNAAITKILEDLSSGRAAAGLGGEHGLSAAQQLRIQDLLARHHDF